MKQGVVEWAYFEGWLLDVYNYENNEYSLVLAVLGTNKWTNQKARMGSY